MGVAGALPVCCLDRRVSRLILLQCHVWMRSGTGTKRSTRGCPGMRLLFRFAGMLGLLGHGFTIRFKQGRAGIHENGLHWYFDHLRRVGKRMYPVIDIHPSSPSLKRTQRETNFLSRKKLLSRTERSVDRRQHTAVGEKAGRWSWQVLFKLFDVKKKRRKKKKAGNRSAVFLYSFLVVRHVRGPTFSVRP